MCLCAYKTSAKLKDSSSDLPFDLRMFCVCHPPPNLLVSEVSKSGKGDSCRRVPSPVPVLGSASEDPSSSLDKQQESSKEECGGHVPDVERDDMLVRRMGTFQRCTTSPVPMHCHPLSETPHPLQQRQGEAVAAEKDLKPLREAERSENRSRSLLSFVPGLCVVLAALIHSSHSL